ncbi:Aste57867_3003 [Aphanomyces stellatus]|uniref:Aste57867_3003 protein n=1 Tax=Aphanomyces stellatus TaxID=120398 RepID=A0A485KD36_9STRA|nr:hypothetical protein As57867_002994 [Aphanomyces stellatus]VFT80184.1 Aste57867_3003 [Aphanomyces stellatus]
MLSRVLAVILSVFAQDRSASRTFLLDYVTQEAMLSVDHTMLVERCSLDAVQVVFAMFFKPDNSARAEHAATLCLVQATKLPSTTERAYAIVRWLVFSNNLDALTSVQVLSTSPHGKNTMTRAIAEADLEMALILQALGVPVVTRLVKNALFDSSLHHVTLALELIRMATDATTQKRTEHLNQSKWIEWLVAQLGGTVVVMGHLILLLARAPTLPRIFPKLYATWWTQANNADEKCRIQMTVVQCGNTKAVSCVVRLASKSLDLLVTT